MSTSSTPPRLIWYRLVGADTGQPYRGTSADKVRLSHDSDVAEFRKAVHVENSAIFTDITSSQLLVYKNQDSFDKRKATDATKEEPLEEDSLINELGNSKKEALIVVVPVVSYGKGADTITMAERVRDISVNLYQQLTEPFDREPSIDELKQYLSSEPRTPLPLLTHRYTAVANYFFESDMRKFEKYFIRSLDEDFSVANLLESLPKMRIELGRGGESVLHFYMDFFMRGFLKVILTCPTLNVDIDRNTGDISNTTSNSRLRPDFLFYVNSFLILRGEVKKDKGGLTQAKNEIFHKLKTWNNAIFGSLNYIFAFVCAGEAFLLCAIGPSRRIYEISRILDLQRISDRFELFFLLINLARVIKTIAYRLPYEDLVMYRAIERADGSSIELTDDAVIKKIPISNEEDRHRFTFLKNLYRSMDRKKVPCVCEVASIHYHKGQRNSFIRIHSVPKGCRFIPPSLDILLAALNCVLLALNGVHKLGYAHCDVRWPNVLRVTDEQWILIDFENAANGNENVTLFQNDIKMVGLLMNSCPFLLPPNVGNFRNLLVSDHPPDASGALTLLAALSSEVTHGYR